MGKLNPKGFLPGRPYDIYLQGLQALMEKANISLDEARRLALEDYTRTPNDEHIHLLEAAYSKLKEGE